MKFFARYFVPVLGIILTISTIHTSDQSMLRSAIQPKFDWSKVLHIPPGVHLVDGNQILHFKSRNKHYSVSQEATIFVETFLSSAVPLQSDAEVLKFGSDAVSIPGTYLEMGVCTGKTINFIAALNPLKIIHGFDSFQGLPEDWVRSDITIPKSTFAFKDAHDLPSVLHNVVLYKGWFQDVLPHFKKEILKDNPVAFLHIDCDIYSATKTVFDTLGDNIVDGTIIVFDEFYNYPGCQNHEIKAFQEFLDARNFSVEYLAYNMYHEQVAVRIKEKQRPPTFNSLQDVYNFCAPHYQTLVQKTGYNVINWLTRKYDFLSNTSQRVLDLGCADGMVGEFLHAHNPEYNFVGIDYSSEMVKCCAQKAIYSDVIVADLSNGLPEQINSQLYDIVLATGCLEFIQNHDQLFTQIYQALKPDGQFWLTLQVDTESCARTALDTSLNLYTQEQALSLFKKHNFHVLDFEVNNCAYTQSKTQKPCPYFMIILQK